MTPFDGRREVPEELNQLSFNVIGACIAVHRELGAGLPEEVYANALAMELEALKISFERERRLEVYYRGKLVGYCKVDFIVAGKLVIELKSVDCFSKQHIAQVITYLRILKEPLGLLVNFNVPVLKDGIKRVIQGRDF
ncbi:MAG: GxxExxY protein [Burkholderiales bacterium]|nr:GxxExxY protein [Phycisphaerae bacterium]